MKGLNLKRFLSKRIKASPRVYFIERIWLKVVYIISKDIRARILKSKKYLEPILLKGFNLKHSILREHKDVLDLSYWKDLTQHIFISYLYIHRSYVDRFLMCIKWVLKKNFKKRFFDKKWNFLYETSWRVWARSNAFAVFKIRFWSLKRWKKGRKEGGERRCI